MSNQSANQARSISSSGTLGGYSTSPTQLSLQQDSMPTSLSNPYGQAYTYSNPHDPNQFAFAPQAQYRQSLHTQTLNHLPHVGHHIQAQSPTNSRKRRASDLMDLNNHAGPSSDPNMNPYGIPQHLGGVPAGIDVGLGPPQPQIPAPGPIKKGRTNTPWTPAEEQRLKSLRDAGSSWSEIAKTFPTRTEGSVKKHWYKDMHYAEFAEDEVSSFSAALLQAIKDYDNNKWKVIGQKVGKPAKACEQFAKEQGWKV